MGKLIIKEKTIQGLSQYCTDELIQCVFSHINTNDKLVDKTNLCKNTWEITSLLQANQKDLLDSLKVIYVFSKLDGTLIYEGNEVPYQSLSSLINKMEPYDIMLYWGNNNANGIQPIYDIGEIEIPQIMPRFVCTQLSDNVFEIEKWVNGEYIPLKGAYTSREACEKVVRDLNQEFESNE